MHRLTQADLPDLARYPVSLQQVIVALWGVEPEPCAPALPGHVTPPASEERRQPIKGSGITK